MKYLIVIWLTIASTNALIAYDCQNSATNITMISLNSVKECPNPKSDYVHEDKSVYVFQKNRFHEIQVYTCMIEITRVIAHCGMHSHSSIVSHGIYTYIHKVGKGGCHDMHRYREYRGIYGHVFSPLQANATTNTPINIAGRVDRDGYCQGTTFSEFGTSWDNVIVTATVKITLQDYAATLKIEHNEVSLRGGVTCPYLIGYCLDTETGETVWETMTQHDCLNYVQLYEGPAKFVTHHDKQQLSYAVIDSGNKIFALSLLHQEIMCGMKVWLTEHPQIILAEKIQGANSFVLSTARLGKNADLTTYVNTKFMYVEVSFKTSLNALAADAVYRRCEIRREMLKNRLALATTSANVVSTLIKEELGYVGKVVGEMLYILQCVPRKVEIRREEKCYMELPVKVNDENLFMAPLTRILKKYGEQVDCNSVIPPMYLIENKWTSFNPKPSTGYSPQQLEVDEEISFNFNSIRNLGDGGIYTQEEIQQAQDSMLFGYERTAINNIITRRMTGRETDTQGISALSMFSTQEIEKLAKGSFDKIWGWFMNIGYWTSGIIGLVFIAKCIKLVLEVTINAIAIHKTHGWSIKLLASFWDTLTIWFLHDKHKKDIKKHNEMSKDQLTTVISTIPSAPQLKEIQNEQQKTMTNPFIAEEAIKQAEDEFKTAQKKNKIYTVV